MTITTYDLDFSRRTFGAANPKQFYRKLEAIFAELQTAVSTERFARGFIDNFMKDLSELLNVGTVHLYDCESGAPQIAATWGSQVPFDLTTVDFSSLEFPWVSNHRGFLTAVLPVGCDSKMLITFFSQQNPNGSEAGNEFFWYAFSSIHYALIQNVRRLELQDIFLQTRAIQLSLLPENPPVFGKFDIAGACVPAKSVGGDMYDYQIRSDESLAIAITDAAGHGLPAALQARDVITGFRMGVRAGMEMPEIAEKLNYVIHQSGLVSRFVSIVFGELQLDGRFEYVNAGHPRPLLLTDSKFTELEIGGTILGPLRNSIYRSETVWLEPGSMLALFSDGIPEHCSPEGEEFGVNRIMEWMQQTSGEPAADAIQDLFQRLKEFGRGASFKDDVTVVVIRMPAAAG
jgi:hypothetical protein